MDRVTEAGILNDAHDRGEHDDEYHPLCLTCKSMQRNPDVNANKPGFPAYLIPYWGDKTQDPREAPAYCAKQARKTPAIPSHNGEPCLACGKSRAERKG